MYKLIQKKKKKRKVTRFPFDAQESMSGHSFSPLYMDKWGVAQSANEGTSGVWIKIAVAPALHHIRRSPYNID